MTERRFTDQEVALVLQRASKLEAETEAGAEGSVGARGLTMRDLEQIAGEVGIAPALVQRAVSDMDARRGAGGRGGILGPAGVAKMIDVVPRPLDREQMLSLVRAADDALDLPGSVTEALGEVRWSGRDRFQATQVAFATGEQETVIRVQHRYTGRAKRVAHFVPSALALMLGSSLVGGTGLVGAGVVAVAVGSGVVGLGVGRLVWRALCDRARRRAAGLLDMLVSRASERDATPPRS